MGAFISLMSSSFAYEDPLIRQQQQAIGAISTTAKAKEIFAEMGRGMWRSGKGFAKVTVLFAGTECVIESVSFSFFAARVPSPTGSRVRARCRITHLSPFLAAPPFRASCPVNPFHCLTDTSACVVSSSE